MPDFLYSHRSPLLGVGSPSPTVANRAFTVLLHVRRKNDVKSVSYSSKRTKNDIGVYRGCGSSLPPYLDHNPGDVIACPTGHVTGVRLIVAHYDCKLQHASLFWACAASTSASSQILSAG